MSSKFFWIRFLVFFFMGMLANQAPASGFPEYQVKAQMLVRMAEFVDWPAGTFSSEEEPFIIAIAGKDPFGPYLKELARNEKIKNHPILLRDFTYGVASETCHMLFVGKAEQAQLDQILSQIDASPILSVGDTESMSKKGTHIGFQVSEGRMRFQINLRSAKNCHLVIASQLLRLATKVFDE